MGLVAVEFEGSSEQIERALAWLRQSGVTVEPSERLPSARIAYGSCPAPTDFPPICVLPSTSGAARGAWDARYWHDVAALLRAMSPDQGSLRCSST